MSAPADIPLPCRIIALVEERNRLFSRSLDELTEEIRTIGFRCGRCGMCCTRAVNGHIFLLDHDVSVVKRIDPAAYEPAPDPEFCDQNGMLYGSGFALRMKDDGNGSCWFFENGKCGIYGERFSGCRIYPHMLRRSPGPTGEVLWRRFARMGEHGHYNAQVPESECRSLAQEIIEYENAVLTQQISFLESVHEFFSIHGLRNSPELYGSRMQRFREGRPVPVMVFHEGELQECLLGRPVE